MDRLTAILREPRPATPQEVSLAVAEAAGPAVLDGVRRQTLADAIASLFDQFGDPIALALPPRLVAAFLTDARLALVTLVVERWMALGAWDRVTAIAPAIAAGGVPCTSEDGQPFLAFGRALAFLEPEAARALLARRFGDASADGPLKSAIGEAYALIAAIEDLPPAELAARRALARIAAERDWKPDSWGRDHGALVGVVRRFVRPGSDGFGGPLIRYLSAWAPQEVSRIAKRASPGADDPPYWARIPGPSKAVQAIMQSQEYLGRPIHTYEEWVGASDYRDAESKSAEERRRAAATAGLRAPSTGSTPTSRVDPAARSIPRAARKRYAIRDDRREDPHARGRGPTGGLGIPILFAAIVVAVVLLVTLAG